MIRALIPLVAFVLLVAAAHAGSTTYVLPVPGVV